jgi:hypothetical protein
MPILTIVPARMARIGSPQLDATSSPVWKRWVAQREADTSHSPW